MAIAFNCPHCMEAYRLPDKLAGKQAKCKNPECRKVITIPTPVTIPDDGTPLDAEAAAAAEAAALAALADEPPKPEEVAAQLIPMTCDYCQHQWTEPRSKAGKNVLCPNPECRQRAKVPEPKDGKGDNWQQQNTKLPSLARELHEKPADIVDAGATKAVGGKTLLDAGVIEIELEPRPLKEKILIGVAIATVVLGPILGIWYWRSTRITGKEEALIAEARKAFDEGTPAMNSPDAGQSSAVLHLAAAEWTLRHDQEKDPLKHAHEELVKARADLLKLPPSPGRNAVAAELALGTLLFAGTDEQVKEQLRYRWVPDDTHKYRLNEKSTTVHQELTTTLQHLLPATAADFDFRITTARRLARELAKRGQPDLAADLLPLALFSTQEAAEARGAIALEIHRAVQGSPLPARIAEELKKTLAGGAAASPVPTSAMALFNLLGTDKLPPGLNLPSLPPPSQPLTDIARQSHTAALLLKGSADEALKMAQRPGQGAGAYESQLKALLLCAEWATDPGPVLDVAVGVVGAAGKGKQATSALQSNILRLSQLASAAGRHDQAKALAASLTDEAVRAWAQGDGVRQRVQANPKEKADEAWVEAPDLPKSVKAGHAWGRLWVARQNTKLTHDRDGQKNAVAGWGTVKPFGLSGIALGLQDE